MIKNTIISGLLVYMLAQKDGWAVAGGKKVLLCICLTISPQLQIVLRNIQSLCIEARELRCGGVRFFHILLTAPCCILLLAYKKCAN